ncbi:DUF1768-domain-containing protein [Amniculicola lignicola CBS 123094]|uniref:DUF1768-domain-containing protein n=1 Tax=Amniculicola lignicola CBS 123094 TaxID=1392246 RepID=A0A6A5X2B1_9PLEO|nr:DUF1768-domain-containing protein [Amniculicola lignicola CBS 123094]
MPPKGKKQPSKTVDRVTKELQKGKAKSTSRRSKSASKSPELLKKAASAQDPSTMSVSTISAASAASASKETETETRPVYFWKPHEKKYGYLGQWYESEFEVGGDTYVTAEMWMMVGKARLFKDEDVALEMLATTDPKTHKALGRQVGDFDAGVWDENKLRIVEEGTYYKFTKSKDAEVLRGWLLETGERELVEASPMDRIWGIGFGEKNAGKMRDRWGQNLLGKALMNVRARLREEEAGKGKGEGDV